MKPAAAAALGALVLLLLAGCGERREVQRIPNSQTQLTLALAGPISALYGPLFAAQAAGELSRAELAVTPSASASGAAALERLAGGTADVAVASEPDVIAARDRGERLVSIGALVQGPLQALLSIAPHPIAAVARLRGQAVATTGQPLQNAELDTMLASAQLPAGSVRRVPAGSDPTSALPHKAVAALGGFSNFDAVALEQRHLQATAIGVQSAGVPAYTELALVVREAQARHHGPALRALLQALARGATQLRANPKPALEALLAASPQLNRGFELGVLQRTAPLLLPSSTRRPYGFQDPLTWRRYGAWMLSHQLIGAAPRAELAVTNEFLPGQGE